ncbi:hypothetical protein M011DRAFT_273159 [Sporormia fimetaria CBS 119925]|uniref:Uncharacterized protein n=1 Tax=Sporormia fimetaria CBS 119925 TaxID=1340428 RepID=A0A6A6VJD7_9PLEO|nr:hypothetical protein M011DRAFT_273159 [Sporormia fimetaria CBS 119925]
MLGRSTRGIKRCRRQARCVLSPPRLARLVADARRDKWPSRKRTSRPHLTLFSLSHPLLRSCVLHLLRPSASIASARILPSFYCTPAPARYAEVIPTL